MTTPMNPGSLRSRAPKFDRSARDYMDKTELSEWRGLDDYSQGSRSQRTHALIMNARARKALPDIVYGKQERRDRRKMLRSARPKTQKLAFAVKRAINNGNDTQVRNTAIKYFRSFDTKFLAYSRAWEKMAKDKRPHIGALRELAKDFNPFKLEIETGRLFFQGRDWACAGQRRTGRSRPLIEYGIHHRARQQQVLALLEVCFGKFIRDDQLCYVARGRDLAVQRAIKTMNYINIEFVAECDITNFFPSVGENSGSFGPALTLQAQLPMLPRAVVDSTVLSSGVIAEQASHLDLEVPNHQTYARTGMPQGSALSSFLAEYIMSDIMSNAETLQPQGNDMIAYVDNIGLFGETADDINGMIEPLVVSSRGSPFGSFGLRRSQTTRHKSEGFIFLGYYLKWENETQMVCVDVSERNKAKFQGTLDLALRSCHSKRGISKACLNENRQDVLQKFNSWLHSFRLVPDIEAVGKELFSEVLRDHSKQVRKHFRKLTKL